MALSATDILEPDWKLGRVIMAGYGRTTGNCWNVG
jgi:hypothetical protein